MQMFKINAQDCFYSLADQNIGHCVELTFLEGKLGRFLMLTFFKWSFFKKKIGILKVKKIQLRWELFQFLSRDLDPYHKKSTQVALKEGLFYTIDHSEPSH